MNIKTKQRVVGGLVLLALILILVPLISHKNRPSSVVKLSTKIPIAPSHTQVTMPENLATVAQTAQTSTNKQQQHASSVKQTVHAATMTVAVKQAQPQQHNPSKMLSSKSAGLIPARQLPVNTSQQTNLSSSAPQRHLAKMPARASGRRSDFLAHSQQADLSNSANANFPSNHAYVAIGPSTVHNQVEQPLAKPQSSRQSVSSEHTLGKSKQHVLAALPSAWTVQVGSFGNAQNAQRLVKQLRGRGYTVYVRVIKAHQQPITEVFVGPLLHREQAQQIQGVLKQQYKIKGIIRKYRV